MTARDLFAEIIRAGALIKALSAAASRCYEDAVSIKGMRYDQIKVSGTTRKDTLDLIEAAERKNAALMNRLCATMEQLKSMQLMALAMIAGLTSNERQEIMLYRYITGLKWTEIADKTGYTERQVYRIANHAISEIEDSENENMS